MIKRNVILTADKALTGRPTQWAQKYYTWLTVWFGIIELWFCDYKYRRFRIEVQNDE